VSAATESVTAKGPLAAPLAAGVQTLSQNQEVTFTQYVRTILPIDGFVFLVRADLLTSDQRALAYGSDAAAATAPLTFTQRGSLHYATDSHQEETETFTTNQVIFTALGEVAALNLASPAIVWLGEIDDIRFAFSSRGSFYQQADLWHYRGSTRWSDLASQIIDDPADLDLTHAVVSGSLPIWLSLQAYVPPVALVANPNIVLYPSYLVPRNLVPPYGVVHIEPSGTIGLAAAPTMLDNSTLQQLCVDEVEITLYGCRNDAAIDLIAWVQQYALFNHLIMGIMNIPVVRDEKKGQVELQAIAQKKTIRFDVNYYQLRAQNIARQLITQAIVNYIPAAL
jgi:hypothetical protein